MTVGRRRIVKNYSEKWFKKKKSMNLYKINRKFRVATEIGSTFFGCGSVPGI
jgi:hypothetical protein